jgi:hypothetical protein
MAERWQFPTDSRQKPQLRRGAIEHGRATVRESRCLVRWSQTGKVNYVRTDMGGFDNRVKREGVNWVAEDAVDVGQPKPKVVAIDLEARDPRAMGSSDRLGRTGRSARSDTKISGGSAHKG